MTQLLRNRWLLPALQFGIGAVFIYAGFTKIQNPQALADSIATFQIVPSLLINLFALGLPPFEIIVGLLLITGWPQRAAAFSSMMLAVAFAFAIGQALARGLDVDCGCFGSGEPSMWKTWAALGRDILLMGSAFIVYRSILLSNSMIKEHHEAAMSPGRPHALTTSSEKIAGHCDCLWALNGNTLPDTLSEHSDPVNQRIRKL